MSTENSNAGKSTKFRNTAATVLYYLTSFERIPVNKADQIDGKIIEPNNFTKNTLTSEVYAGMAGFSLVAI